MMRIYEKKAFAPPYNHKGIVMYQKKNSVDFWRVYDGNLNSRLKRNTGGRISGRGRSHMRMW
jgi:hypothetical protein